MVINTLEAKKQNRVNSFFESLVQFPSLKFVNTDLSALNFVNRLLLLDDDR